MLTENFPSGMVADLADGTVIEDRGHKVILGESDTVAFTDSDGNWQVATGVVFNAVEDSARFELLLRRKRINDIISKHFPEGTLDEFYSESSDHAVVLDRSGVMFQIYPDGSIKSYA